MVKADKDCKDCGGKGFIMYKDSGMMKRKPCECKILRNFKDKIEPEYIDPLILKEKIPNPRYREDFDEEELEETIDIPDKLWDIQVEMYIEFLDTYIRTVRMGKKPEKSYFVVAPSGSGKKYFVYNAIKSALQGGLTTTSLIDTHDVYDLMGNKKFGELKSMLMADVAFLTLGGSPVRPDMIALRAVLDICDRYGIPLVVISRFSGGYLKKLDSLIAQDVGVFSTKKWEYGRLEQVGFSDEFMIKHRNYKQSAGKEVESVADFKERVRRGEE